MKGMPPTIAQIRRSAIVYAAAACALTGWAPAMAQDFPTKTIRIVVPFQPGGATDFWARLFAVKFREKWGQSAIVENRAGAGGNIGTEMVAKSDPDGHTLLFTAPGPLVINRHLYTSLNFSPEAFVPVSIVYENWSVLSVHPKTPVNSLKDLIDAAKANPDRFNYSSSGNGTTQHLAFELLKMKAGINVTHIPYGGNGPALTDLVAGQVDMMFVEMGTAIPYISSGKLRALAVGGSKRSHLLPDVPTLSESIQGVFAVSWAGAAAPPGTPMPIARKLSDAFREILKQPDVVKRLEDLNTEAIGSTPEEMATLLKEDNERWGEIVRGIKLKIN